MTRKKCKRIYKNIIDIQAINISADWRDNWHSRHVPCIVTYIIYTDISVHRSQQRDRDRVREESSYTDITFVHSVTSYICHIISFKPLTALKDSYNSRILSSTIPRNSVSCYIFIPFSMIIFQLQIIFILYINRLIPIECKITLLKFILEFCSLKPMWKNHTWMFAPYCWFPLGR